MLKGGLGALGIAIGATAVPFKGAWAVDSSAIKSSASTIRSSTKRKGTAGYDSGIPNTKIE